MKTFVIAAIIAAAAAGCSKTEPTSTTQTTSSTLVTPDHTQLNGRERAGAITPLQQGEDMADIRTTQAIRKAIMAEDRLSMDAKNVKIVTTSGTVTLRGTVKDKMEKDLIDGNARAAAGVNQVDDQLEVQELP